MMFLSSPVQILIYRSLAQIGNSSVKKLKSALHAKYLRKLQNMKRKQNLRGFKKHQSQERLKLIEQSWKHLPPLQQLRFTLIILWHATPTLYQIINHIKYFGSRWFDRKLYPAHWVK